MTLAAEHLVKRYGDFTAVDDVSFTVRPGEILALLGPNGSGKTTILRAAGATLRLTSGRVLIEGRDVAVHPREAKRRLGVVHQEDTLDPDLTVRENLLVHARYFELPLSEAETRADDLLEKFQLGRWRDTGIMKLSGGLRRRLMLARAFFHAKLLILDEPTTGLDPEARLQLWGDIRGMLSSGVAVLLTSHDMEETDRLADRVILMDRGRARREGTPKELIEHETSGRVFEIRIPVPELESAGKYEFDLRAALSADKDARVTRHGGFLFCQCGNDEALASWSERRKLPLTVRQANLGDVYLSVTGRELVPGADAFESSASS
ncbi:MAG: ABC transporter ATP-binding protein [Candidatus Hydrogenedentota bacterium]|mgnify:CR=1 FL=1